MGRTPSHHGETAQLIGATAGLPSSAFTRRGLFSLAMGAGAALWLKPQLLYGAASANVADSSEEARSNAEAAIPFDKLRPETKAKVLSIVDRPSLYRRLPIQNVACDHEMHVFLTRYPEVVVNIWRLMKITNIQVTRSAEYSVDISDGAGTVSRVDLIYGTPELHLFYCQGEYEGPLFKRKLTGRSVLLLRSNFAFDRARQPVVTDQLDVFLTIDNTGAELIAKTLSGTVGKTVDTNFIETTKFITRISDSAERNGSGMQSLAAKLDQCSESVRKQFSDVCTATGERSAQRLAALTASQNVSSDVRPTAVAVPRR